MNQPKVTIHIFSSLDGRITGDFGNQPAVKDAAKLFKQIGFNDDSPLSMHFDGWIYGKNTSLDGFGNHQAPKLDPQATAPAGDFVIDKHAKRYYIAIDRHGEIGWQKDTASYGGQEASVIEVLTDQVSAPYRHFLREMKIPYIVAGSDTIDLKLMLTKLHDLFGLNNLLLGGGGILNWSFLDAGLVDEMSLVMAPVVDGDNHTARLFDGRFAGHSHPVNFLPIKLKAYDNGVLWLRYRPEYR